METTPPANRGTTAFGVEAAIKFLTKRKNAKDGNRR
jgi:hypothetical protein